MRVTPSLPQRGRQHAGNIPLPPLLSGFFINLLKLSHYDARAAGADARYTGAPRSDCLFLFRVSTKQIFLKMSKKGVVPNTKK